MARPLILLSVRTELFWKENVIWSSITWAIHLIPPNIIYHLDYLDFHHSQLNQLVQSQIIIITLAIWEARPKRAATIVTGCEGHGNT